MNDGVNDGFSNRLNRIFRHLPSANTPDFSSLQGMPLNKGNGCFNRFWKMFIDFQLIQKTVGIYSLKTSASNDCIRKKPTAIFAKK